jgi:hypothetical protein
MIAVSWLDIVTGALAAAKAEGRTPTAAEINAITLAAKGIESVLASTIESPGTTIPISFSLAQLGALALANATGQVLTITPSAAMGADYALTMPVADGGAGQVLATDGAGVLSWVAPGGSASVDVEDEGVAVVSASTMNFVGEGVTATTPGAGVATITVPGTVDIQDEGVAVVSARTINFVGAGVTATTPGGTVTTVTIPGGGGGTGNGYFPQGW